MRFDFNARYSILLKKNLFHALIAHIGTYIDNAYGAVVRTYTNNSQIKFSLR